MMKSIQLALTSSPFRTAFWTLIVILLGLLPILSLDYGITWDQWWESLYAMLLLRFFVSGGADQIFLQFTDAVYYNQPLYVLAQALCGLWTGSVYEFAYTGLLNSGRLFGYFTLTHILNAFFGFLAILYTGLLAKKLSTWRAACLAVLFLTLSPRFFGNLMNNLKDIPFATAYVISLYYLVKFVTELPEFKKLTVIFLTLSLGLILSIRIGGILLIAYLFLFTGTRLVRELFFKKTNFPWKQTLTLTVVISFLSYLIGIGTWPYGLLNPLTHPWIALSRFSKYSFGDGPIFFDGVITMASKLPWYYLIKSIWITSPVFFAVGLGVFLFALPKLISRLGRGSLLTVLFSALFPLFYILVNRSIVYDSWRHVLFIYPPLIVLIALAWNWVFDAFRQKFIRLLLWVLVAAQLAEPFVWMYRNHPNEYVYYSPLVGGIDQAAFRHETDYWGNSLRKASEWLASYHERTEPNRRIIVRADGNIMSSYCYLKRELGPRYVALGYPRDFVETRPFFPFVNYKPFHWENEAEQKLWDYAIVMTRGWSAENIRRLWPPKHTIYEVRADRTTLCAVVKNPRS